MGIQNSFGKHCGMLDKIFAKYFDLNNNQKTELHSKNNKFKFERETCNARTLLRALGTPRAKKQY
jgi:hypothetical protein